MKIYNSTQNNLIASDAEVADNFVTRTFGLIPKRDFFVGQALLIKPCFSIHTFFMRYEIDVLFVNRKHETVALYEKVKPWGILPFHFTSSYVIELPAGQITDKKIQKGDIIRLEKE